MNFTTNPSSTEHPNSDEDCCGCRAPRRVTLSLHPIGNGAVELWAYAQHPDDGYRIGIFRDGAFVTSPLPARAQVVLALETVDGGHLLVKQD